MDKTLFKAYVRELVKEMIQEEVECMEVHGRIHS